MDSKFLKNWIFGFIATKIFAKKDYKNRLLFYYCKTKTAFSLFSLLFDVKTRLILIQKVVLIHNPGDNFGQVKLTSVQKESGSIQD